MRPKRERAAALTMLAGLAFAGCGSTHANSPGGQPTASPARSYPEAARSAQQIYADVKAGARTVRSVRISGSVTQRGETMSLDLVLARTASRGKMTANGVTIRLIRIGSTGYVKVPKTVAGNRLLSGFAHLPTGRWIKIPIADVNSMPGPDAILGSLTIKKILGQMFTVGDPLAKGSGIHVIGGIATVGLKDTTDGSLMYVAVSGTPRPIEVTGGRGESGSMLFSDYNLPVNVTRPADAVSFPGAG